MNYPFYIIKVRNEWIVVSLKRDIKHTTLWEILVAKMVADFNKLKYENIKNLPYCQVRGRVVDDKIYIGDDLTDGQKKAIKDSVGDFEFVYDEHEKMTDYDVEIFRNILKSER
jgi:hypothetical protein